MDGYAGSAPRMQAITDQIGGSGSRRASVHAGYSETIRDRIGENLN
jgi:hypothetical protein